jgi:NAD(P)-dependent dehydrogenase (short-subunit alcohol dehydrogenase family)
MLEESSPWRAEEFLTTLPVRRLVRPDEIAAACAFLASDDASAITGTDLTVDCGLTSNWFILETLPEG